MFMNIWLERRHEHFESMNTVIRFQYKTRMSAMICPLSELAQEDSLQ